MLHSIRAKLNGKLVILGSTSPRRFEILKLSGLDFEVCPSNTDEVIPAGPNITKEDIVIHLAKEKCEAVLQDVLKQGKKPHIVIGADTIVYHEDSIYGKPKDPVDALQMLSKLNGKVHTVVTGVCIAHGQGTESSWNELSFTHFAECTKVRMAEVHTDVLQAYVNTGEPLDKAGAYGIQGIGGTLIESIEGDYYNVMGLPLHRTVATLYRLFHQ